MSAASACAGVSRYGSPEGPTAFNSIHNNAQQLGGHVAGCGSLPAAASAKSCLYTAKPVVSAVFPKSAGKAVSHIHSHDPFGILEAELGSDAQLKRISVFRREGL